MGKNFKWTAFKLSALMAAALAATAGVAFLATSNVRAKETAAPSKEEMQTKMKPSDLAKASEFCGWAANGNTNLVLHYPYWDSQAQKVACAAVCAAENDHVAPRRKEWECGA